MLHIQNLRRVMIEIVRAINHAIPIVNVYLSVCKNTNSSGYFNAKTLIAQPIINKWTPTRVQEAVFKVQYNF